MFVKFISFHIISVLINRVLQYQILGQNVFDLNI